MYEKKGDIARKCKKRLTPLTRKRPAQQGDLLTKIEEILGRRITGSLEQLSKTLNSKSENLKRYFEMLPKKFDAAELFKPTIASPMKS